VKVIAIASLLSAELEAKDVGAARQERALPTDATTMLVEAQR